MQERPISRREQMSRADNTERVLAQERARGMVVKALSIRQPWAWLILHAGKDIENRTWKMNYRGDLALHASGTMEPGDYAAGLRMWIKAQRANPLLQEMSFPTPTELKPQMGGIVGIMEMDGCVEASESLWFEGPYGFVIRGVRPVTFQMCRGALGIFDVAVPWELGTYRPGIMGAVQC